MLASVLTLVPPLPRCPATAASRFWSGAVFLTGGAVEAGAEPPGFPAGIDFSLLQSFGGDRKAEKQWWQ